MTGHEDSLHQVILMPSGRRGRMPEGTTVLDLAEKLGIGLESICGGRQTCGKCVVEPEFGTFPKHGIRSSSDHLSPVDSAEDECSVLHGVNSPAQRLACAARLQGDLLVHVPDESLARKQTIRKEPGELNITVAPAMRLLYVEVDSPTLGGASDAERLREAFMEQWSLDKLSLDPILLPHLRDALRQADGAVTCTLWNDQEILRIEPGYVDGIYGLAVDIGSTTIAANLTDLRTGELMASSAAMNPQVRYGEDLMSRVSYAMMEPQGTERMRRSVVRSIDELAARCAEQAGIRADEICELVAVGNTVMHHIMLGINPTDLGSAPFALSLSEALDARARDFGYRGLHPSARLHVPPCIAGHVGADCAAVLLSQAHTFDDRATLIIDVGTNAEIMLSKGERLLVASSPTGPALEGAQIEHGQRAAPGAIERVRIDPGSGKLRYRVVGDSRWSNQLDLGESLRPTGICGSGIIEAVGELSAAGWLEPSGRLTPGRDGPSDLIRLDGRTFELVLAPAAESASEHDIVITQNDIRAVQLAKAALYAGARLLMDQMGIDAVDRVRLAGAFGSYIDPRHALMIGLIPDCGIEGIEAIGNAAGDGARMALLNADMRRKLQALVERVEYIETALEPRFQEHFVDAMTIPHSRDSFPSLTALIPDIAQGGKAASGTEWASTGVRHRSSSERGRS